jgi:hypothetical protein
VFLELDDDQRAGLIDGQEVDELPKSVATCLPTITYPSLRIVTSRNI